MKEYRIVHLTLNLPGPLALSRLAKTGATVMKVEPPTGDPMEGYNPALYRSMHEGQTILKLDLKNPDQRPKLDELLKDAHLFVTSQRPSALKNLGLDEKSLHQKFPNLQIVRLLGAPPPNEELPTHDLNCQADAGLIAFGASGASGTAPQLPRALISDYAAAERLYSTGLLALLKSKSEPGSTWTVTLTEMAEEFAAPFKLGMTSPDGLLGGALPQYNIYEVKDGWIGVAALEPHFLKRLLLEFALEKPSHAEFKRIFLTKTKSEWEKIAAEKDIPISALK